MYSGPSAFSIKSLLSEAVFRGASDLHLSEGEVPWMRIDGGLVRCESSVLTDQDIELALKECLSPRQVEAVGSSRDYDCAAEIAGLGRVRINVFQHLRGRGIAVRLIPRDIPRLQELGMPSIVTRLSRLDRGLILITGPTGSGKSTTLAALINAINCERYLHIVTIEDPIEFVHTCKNCLIHQREVGASAGSFAQALRAALREDPDIILVGELRDLETIHLALTAAETGHLVMATIHSSSAATTVDRIIDPFPAQQQARIRSMLAESLQAIISQTLCSREGGGRVMAVEILLATPAVRTLIREDKSHQLPGVMQTSQGVGMQTLSAHMQALVAKGIIRGETAVEKLGRIEWLQTFPS